VAGNIIVAWVLTLPAAAVFGALTYSVTRLFGTGAAGPLIVLGLILAASALMFVRRAQQRAPGQVPSTAEASG
jgi:inorganic phosphate transporter, PiT family